MIQFLKAKIFLYTLFLCLFATSNCLCMQYPTTNKDVLTSLLRKLIATLITQLLVTPSKEEMLITIKDIKALTCVNKHLNTTTTGKTINNLEYELNALHYSNYSQLLAS